MKNTGTEILNQVMNRWVENFRATQATKVINEKTIDKLGIFELHADERAILAELSIILSNRETSNILA